ncbi:hypothetical protein [Archangium violaceum]|uniref:hypothetical protein n=1 Tax=Archangium violaceum TaxID=83451 RepID=UPI00069663DF|nr:hypothetical protein [Archangium violaceum]
MFMLPLPRQALRLALAALSLGFVPAVHSAPAPDYARYTTTQLLPYENARSNVPPFTEALKFQFSVDGKPYLVTMDTGTTGIMLSARSLPNYSPEGAARYPQGWEFLSSSKILWVGHWVPKEVTFTGAGGVPVTAQVPVLAIEQEVVCPDYKKDDKATCPGKPLGTASDKIAYMGVGFGREHDGQPQGTPDKNPFLNITKINGKPVTRDTMRDGYLITPEGVHVGLTAANTSGFVFTQLGGTKYSKDPRDWPEASICVAVGASPCVPGAVLVDTGIPQMYLTVTSQVNVQTKLAPDLSVKGKKVPVLVDGSQVTVRFPDNEAPVASYTFTVGDTAQANPLAPAQVITTANGKTVFVNTGRHFLRGFNVLFDAEGGLFGLKKTGSANSSGGETPKR